MPCLPLPPCLQGSLISCVSSPPHLRSSGVSPRSSDTTPEKRESPRCSTRLICVNWTACGSVELFQGARGGGLQRCQGNWSGRENTGTRWPQPNTTARHAAAGVRQHGFPSRQTACYLLNSQSRTWTLSPYGLGGGGGMRRAAGGTRTAGAGGAAGAAACCCSPCCCCSPWARTMGQCVVLRALVGCRAAAKATRAPCRAARMAGAAAGDGDAAAAMCKYGFRDAGLG